jgi:hypothetical protein
MLGDLRYLNQKEGRMTKFRLIGVAAVLSSVLAAPAMARHVIAHPGHYALSTYCATIEPGNPIPRCTIISRGAAGELGVVGIVVATMLAPVTPRFQEEASSKRRRYLKEAASKGGLLD